MPYITASDGTDILVYFSLKDALQPTLSRSDIVKERDLVGTDRTMVNRLGFSSREMTREIWTDSTNMVKLDTARNNAVVYEGNSYSLTFTSEVQAYIHTDIQKVTIRLKRI